MNLFQISENLRAELSNNYIAFNNGKPFGVYILNEENKERDFYDFATKEEAIKFINSFNCSPEQTIEDAYNYLHPEIKENISFNRIIQDLSDKLCIPHSIIESQLSAYINKNS